MGVPAFFRWLSRKYSSVIIDCIEERVSGLFEAFSCRHWSISCPFINQFISKSFSGPMLSFDCSRRQLMGSDLLLTRRSQILMRLSLTICTSIWMELFILVHILRTSECPEIDCRVQRDLCINLTGQRHVMRMKWWLQSLNVLTVCSPSFGQESFFTWL